MIDPSEDAIVDELQLLRFSTAPELERAKAVVRLTDRGGDSTIARLFIELLVRDKHPKVRGNAATGLGRIGDSNAVEALLQALQNDVDPEVRELAASALGRIGDP